MKPTFDCWADWTQLGGKGQGVGGPEPVHWGHSPLERGLGEHTEKQFISLGQKQGRKYTPGEECRRPE